MVTEAGKELLRNSLNTVNFHNRNLEKNEMWKKWEAERNLTMMVSDDDVLKKIRKNHRCSKHRKMDESNEWSQRNDDNKIVAGTSSADRWDHSGFQELYPDEPIDRRPSKSTYNSKVSAKKWGHSGFHELYPDDTSRGRSSSSSPESHLKDSSFREDEERILSSSGKKCKKKCRHCRERFFSTSEGSTMILSCSKKYMHKRGKGGDCRNIIEERRLLSRKKECKGKCHRCKERFSKEKEFRLSHSKKFEREPNHLTYKEVYEYELLKTRSKSPPSRKYDKRSSLTRPSIGDKKWDHDGFRKLYPNSILKAESTRYRKY